MLKYFSAAAVAFALIAAPAAPSFAQATTTEKTEKKAAKKPSEKQSAQQQKMKDCAAGWKDEKAKTGAKGRDAYKKFMSECLKKQA